MTLQTAIKLLMSNDKNATWYECNSIEEIKEGLISAIEGYDKQEETYLFYKSILKNLT